MPLHQVGVITACPYTGGGNYCMPLHQVGVITACLPVNHFTSGVSIVHVGLLIASVSCTYIG